LPIKTDIVGRSYEANEWRPSLWLVVTNRQPELILLYEDILGIRLVLARRIKYRVVGRSIMKKYREEIRLRNPVYSLSLTTTEASRTTIVGNADLS
jgi:hypothetical protein